MSVNFHVQLDMFPYTFALDILDISPPLKFIFFFVIFTVYRLEVWTRFQNRRGGPEDVEPHTESWSGTGSYKLIIRERHWILRGIVASQQARNYEIGAFPWTEAYSWPMGRICELIFNAPGPITDLNGAAIFCQSQPGLPIIKWCSTRITLRTAIPS